MGFVSKRQLSILSGYATTTTCKVVAFSLESSDDITITCGSFNSGAITPTTYAAGAGPTGQDGGYVASTTITGLSPFTQYTWTATQGSESVSGTLMTSPESGDDYSFYFASCDACHSVRASGYDDSYHSYHGFYKNIKEQVESGNYLPCAGIFFVGDHGYTWKKSLPGYFTNFSADSLYDFITAYLSNFPLFDDLTNETVAMGRDEYRDWVHRNLNYWAQWGDHDMGEDAFGWQAGADTRLSNPTQWTALTTAWDAIYGAVAPPRIAGTDHTTHQAWALSLGDVLMIAPDYFTNANGSLDSGTPATNKLLNSATDDQVSEILTACDSDEAFKIIGIECGIRYPSPSVPVPTAGYNIQLGTQQPMADLVPTEYDRMFRASGQTPKSLMDNPKTNGSNGALVCLHGDDHRASAYKHAKAGDGSNEDEIFYEIGCGSINGSIPPGVSVGATLPDIVPGAERDGTTTLYHDLDTGINSAPWPYRAIRVDVYGSRHPKELHVTLMDENSSALWSGKLIHRFRGNNMVDLDDKPISVMGSNYGGD